MKFTVLRREFESLKEPSIAGKGLVVVIGNFDGIHKGHQVLIEKGVKLAKEKECALAVYTFEPHPKKLFLGEKAPKPLMKFAVKAKVLKQLGVNAIIARPFTKELASTSFQEFTKHLCEDIHAKTIVVGEDFVFGKGREGTAEKLKALGESKGFDVSIVKDIEGKDAKRISSSSIRQCLENGLVKDVDSLLGRPFSVTNFLNEDDYCRLILNFSGYTPVKNGVYLAKIQYTDDRLKKGASIVPLTVKNNVGYIAPLPEMPDLPTGKVTMSLIEKIEE